MSMDLSQSIAESSATSDMGVLRTEDGCISYAPFFFIVIYSYSIKKINFIFSYLLSIDVS